MATTTFTDNVTLTDDDWFNDVDALVYDVFNEKTTAGTSGTILRSNGTNIVNTTATYPTTTTANRVLYSTGTNAIGDSANLTFDGTTLTLGGGQLAFPATQNASSDANTLDDYEEGSFTGTLTGCTTSPTQTLYYTKIGNQVTLKMVTAVAGTSNATTKTITGMPAAIRPTTGDAVWAVRISDAGAASVASFAVLATDGSIDMLVSAGGGNWTASGTATIQAFTGSYTLA